MSRRMAIFAFKGDLMCFGHALPNLMDMREDTRPSW